MKTFLMIAILVFPALTFAGNYDRPQCSDLTTAQAAVDTDRQNLKNAENMLKTSLKVPPGQNLDQEIAGLEKTYRQCEKIDLKEMRNSSDLVNAISAKFPNNKAAAAQCYYPVLLHLEYSKVNADELCYCSDPGTLDYRSTAKTAGLFSRKNGVVSDTEKTLLISQMTNSTCANLLKCRSDMRAVGKAVDQLKVDKATYAQIGNVCKDKPEDPYVKEPPGQKEDGTQ